MVDGADDRKKMSETDIKQKKENPEPAAGRKKSRKNIRISDYRTYAICMISIVLLIVLAFFGPQIVFKVQDSYQMERIWQGPRKSLDLEALYGSYGNLRDRMTAFAQRQKETEFHVTGTEYSMTEELLGILDLAVSQECFGLMDDFGIYPGLSYLIERGYTVEQWKQYVIYNDIYDEENTTVLVSGWYVELNTRDDITIKLLVDTETYNLYYLQIVDREDSGWLEYWEMVYSEVLVYAQEVLMEYWFDYYEAGETPVQTYESYRGYAESTKKEINTFATDKGISKTKSYAENKADEMGDYAIRKYSFWEIAMELPYFEDSLVWEMKVEEVPDDAVTGLFSMGIADIAALIPEFQEN